MTADGLIALSAEGGPLDPAEARKARGAFFTPGPICDFLAEWAIRGPEDRVLEPSCGDAAFLTAAGRVLNRLGSPGSHAPSGVVTFEQVQGVELHERSALEAAAAMAAAGVPAIIRQGDFFDFDPTPSFDAVLGNPPYVRYQDFTGEARAKGRRRALDVDPIHVRQYGLLEDRGCDPPSPKEPDELAR